MPEAPVTRLDATAGPVPAVSLGLNVYNAERWIRSCLDSLLAQTFGDFEIVVSDNASTDRTVEVCREYAARDPRIRIERFERNMGISANMNRAFELGRGEFFCWVGATDAYHPKFLETCVGALRAHPEAVSAAARSVTFSDDPAHGHMRERHYAHAALPRPEQRLAALIPSLIDGSLFRGVHRREHVQRFFPLGARFGQDLMLIVQLASVGPILHLDEGLYYERDAPGANTSRIPVHLRLPYYEPGVGVNALVFHRTLNILEMWRIAIGVSRGPLRKLAMIGRALASLVPLRHMIGCDVREFVGLVKGIVEVRMGRHPHLQGTNGKGSPKAKSA